VIGRDPDVILSILSPPADATDAAARARRLWSAYPSLKAVRAGAIRVVADDTIVQPGLAWARRSRTSPAPCRREAMTVIETRGSAIRTAGAPALRDVDLAVPRGELVGIIGRNGAGKTTLARILSGLLAGFRGDVRLLGRPLRAWSRVELARRLAYVAQQPEIAFPYRAGEVVLMGRLPHQAPGRFFDRAEDLRIARESLESVGAAALAERPFADLSGGERQLVVLASALAQRPRSSSSTSPPPSST
jgi:ABC-type molybdenum transport system ATPase subunit/photorepair protein PhrA